MFATRMGRVQLLLSSGVGQTASWMVIIDVLLGRGPPADRMGTEDVARMGAPDGDMREDVVRRGARDGGMRERASGKEKEVRCRLHAGACT